MTVDVAVVGLGTMGTHHARVADELAGVTLAGVCDVDPDAARDLGDRFGVPAFTDLEKLLAEPSLDAVVVATPTEHHRAVALACIEAGKHLLVEKPLADSVGGAREVADAARQAGVRLAVGHVERHNPIVAQVADELAEGRFGDLLTASARRVSPSPGRIRDVGVVLDLAIHDIDIVRHLMARPVRSVYGRVGAERHGDDREDRAHLVLTFEGGAVGVVEANWLTPAPDRRLVLTCTDATVEVDYVDQQATVATFPTDEEDDPEVRAVTPTTEEEPLARQLGDLRDAVDQDREPLVPGGDGVAALRIAEAALTSAREDRAVTMEETA